MRKIRKMTICFVIVFYVISSITTITLAKEITIQESAIKIATIVDPLENPDQYMPKGNSETDNELFIKKGGSIIGVLQLLGTFIMVVSLMVIGIRYMFASTSDKASYKEAMIPYIIGAVMLFTIPNIIGILYDLVVNNIK